MVDLLFNPNGRIATQRFWQGMVFLTVASLLVSAATMNIHENLGLISWVLIFPYICVYGKRLHDAGRTAWWVIAVWFVAVLFQVIALLISLFTLLPIFMSAEQKELFDEVMRLSEKGDTAEAMKGIELLMEKMEGLFQRASLVLLVITNALIALVLGSFKTEPRENKHGPVPGTGAADTFS